jgi:hypothetical protein
MENLAAVKLSARHGTLQALKFEGSDFLYWALLSGS